MHSKQSFRSWSAEVACNIHTNNDLDSLIKTSYLQVIEKSDGDGIVDAVTRLSCEVGVPKYVLCDKQTSIERMLREAQVEIRDLHDKLVLEFGIEYHTCPVSGHNFHGQVERCIRFVRNMDYCTMDVGSNTWVANGLYPLS